MKFKQYYRQVDSERREMLRAFDAQDRMLREQAETIQVQRRLVTQLMRALHKVNGTEKCRQAEIILKQKEVIEVLQAQAEIFRFVVKYGIGVDHAI